MRGRGRERGPSPTFAHCAHAQIRDRDGVTMLLQFRRPDLAEDEKV